MQYRPRCRRGAPLPLRQQLIKVAELLQERRKLGVMPPDVDDLDIMAPGKARQHVVEGIPLLGRMEFDHHIHLLEPRGKLRIKEFPLRPFDVAPHQYFFVFVESAEVLGGKQAADFHIHAIASGKRPAGFLGAGIDIVGELPDSGEETFDADGIVAFRTANIEHRRVVRLRQGVQ